MKPTNSLSKSMKKSTKSRSKLSKSATTSLQASLQQQQATVTHQEAATPTTVQDLPKEKAHHRSYAGFGPKSMKIIWEQHDTSGTDIMPDVYSRLAEDVTYKVWELVNNAKTYARHSGGKVTFDLVNEVLKDSDVPPVLGSVDTEWDKIEYDGNYFFNSDHVLELRDEYLKEMSPKKVYDSEVNQKWGVDKTKQKTVMEFVRCLLNSIFVGNDEAFNYAINIATITPDIGVTLKLILRKCIEMLAFEQKFPIIKRCLQLFKALSVNPCTRHIESNEEFFHVCEILVCLLMGTFNSIKPPPPLPMISKTENKKEESFELVKSFLENSDQEIIIKKDIANFNSMDVDDLRNEYEALFQMMERDGFQEQRDNNESMVATNTMASTMVKTEADDVIMAPPPPPPPLAAVVTPPPPQIMGPPPPPPPLPTTTTATVAIKPLTSSDGISNNNSQASHQEHHQQQKQSQQMLPPPITIKEEKIEPTLMYKVMINEEQQEQQEENNQEKQQQEQQEEEQEEQQQKESEIQFSPYYVEMCDFKNIDLVASTIGHLASQFSYVQNECTFLIQKRMEKFFNYRQAVYCDADFKFISRCVRGLIALGEYAFREIIPFLYKIDPVNAPEWICNDFSVAATFLKGKDDIFLYEWLEELCGDKLQPFLIYSYKYHQKLMTKLYKTLQKIEYTIKPKLILHLIEKKKKNDDQLITMEAYFPEMNYEIRKSLPLSSSPNEKINFRVTGWHPIQRKEIKTESKNEKSASLTNRKIIDNKILICKRKLLKPLTSYKKKVVNLSNFSYLQI